MFGVYVLTPVLGRITLDRQPGFSRPGFPCTDAALFPHCGRLMVRKHNAVLACGKDAGDGSYCRYHPDAQYLKRSQTSGSLWGEEGCDCCLPRSRCVRSRDGKSPGKAPCSLHLLQSPHWVFSRDCEISDVQTFQGAKRNFPEQSVDCEGKGKKQGNWHVLRPY